MKNRIRYYRKKRKLTQSELSKLAKISRQYLSDIETEKKQPTIRIAFIFSRLLDVSIEKLFYFA